MLTDSDWVRHARWPSTPLDEVWCRRSRDLEVVRAFTAEMPEGPHRDFLRAFLLHRDGRTDEAMRLVEALLEDDPFDEVWTTRLTQMHGGLLHSLGLTSQSLETRERALVMARHTGNPTAVILALHDLGVVLERTDGERAQQLYLQAIDLIDAIGTAPPHARSELDSLWALAVVNLHLFSDRTGLPLPAGTPSLPAAQERAQTVWPALSAAVQAFRGLRAHDAGDRDAALKIFTGLPDPLTMHDLDHAVIVATGVATRLMIEGAHQDAIDMLDALAGSVPAQFLHEVLDIKASVLEDAGDFAQAYRVTREMIEGLQRVYGAEARSAVRALEVFYRTDQHREAADAAREESRSIAAQAQAWRRGSLRDPLTDVWNRRHLQKKIDDLRGTVGHQLAVIDLDGFKRVNDEYGHATGDRVLIHVARALQAACSEDDVCVRHGGDEFCVLRPAGADRRLADDLRGVSRPGQGAGEPFDRVTLSIGVVEIGADGFDAAFARADQAMYRIKRAGGAGVGEA